MSENTPFTPKGFTKTTSNKPGRKTRVGGRTYDYADFAAMPQWEKDILITLERLWKKLSWSQNAQIASELGINGNIGIDEGFRWIVRPGNRRRAEAWIEAWFNKFRKI